MFASASRITALRATAAMPQKRTMAGGPKPVWTGIDKTVRGYFPEDWQRELLFWHSAFHDKKDKPFFCSHNAIYLLPTTLTISVAAAILGGYSSLVVVAQISSAMKGKPPVVVEAPKVVVAATTSTGIPDVNSPAFAEYMDSEAFVTLLDSDEQLTALCEQQ